MSPICVCTGSLTICVSTGRSIMDRGGDSDDCLSTPEAEEMAAKLSIEKRNALPKQGEVDFINGGPPCQVLSLVFYLYIIYTLQSVYLHYKIVPYK